MAEQAYKYVIVGGGRAAAAPMRQLYESIEATYADPANHPGSDRAQTEAHSWGALGTEGRLREYRRLLARARHLAREGTELHQQRVALFYRGIYRWMREGRETFLEGQGQREFLTGEGQRAAD